MPVGVYKRNPEVGKRHSIWMKNHPSPHGFVKGHKHSAEMRKKLSELKKGKPSHWKGKKRPEITGEKHPNWKGGKAGLKRYMQEYRRRKRDYINHLNAKRTAWKMRAEGSFTLGEWDLLKRQYGYKCPTCKRKEPEIRLTIDHIIPLSRGGSNYIENIQPLCGRCNCSKGNRIRAVDNSAGQG